MKSWDRKHAFIAGACLGLIWLAAREAPAQELAVPIENLRMPLENYADGSIKTQLKAGKAVVPPSGPIVATNVVLELFRPDTSLDAVITADDCRYDRETSECQSDSKIRIERDGIVITGKGFDWKGEKERVKILSKVRVVFQRDLSKTRAVPAKERKE